MPTDENKMLAKFMHNTFGANPNARVVEHLNEDESTRIPILSCPESPYQGSTTYATVGLSDYPMYRDNQEFKVRVEIVAVGDSSIEWIPSILSTSAFYLMQKGWLYRPGAVVENLVSIYNANTKLKHIYFTSPFLWQELRTLQLDTKEVAWLLLILITEAEYQYLKQHGSDKFEELLEERDADVFNIARNSVI